MKILKTILSFFYTIWFTILAGIHHLWGIFLGVFFIAIGLKGVTAAMTPWWNRALYLFGGKWLKIRGKEKLKKGSNYLLVMNHSSWLDIHAVITIQPYTSWMVKKELMNIFPLNIGIKATRGIAVGRNNFKEAMQSLNKFTNQSDGAYSLGIFPEGTRTKTGHIGKFKRGFVRILKESSLDLVPITLNGFYDWAPKRKFLMNPFAKLEAVIHDPIPNEELKKMEDAEIMKLARETILKDYITPKSAVSVDD